MSSELRLPRGSATLWRKVTCLCGTVPRRNRKLWPWTRRVVRNNCAQKKHAIFEDLTNSRKFLARMYLSIVLFCLLLYIITVYLYCIIWIVYISHPYCWDPTSKAFKCHYATAVKPSCLSKADDRRTIKSADFTVQFYRTTNSGPIFVWHMTDEIGPFYRSSVISLSNESQGLQQIMFVIRFGPSSVLLWPPWYLSVNLVCKFVKWPPLTSHCYQTAVTS